MQITKVFNVQSLCLEDEVATLTHAIICDEYPNSMLNCICSQIYKGWWFFPTLVPNWITNMWK